MIRTRNAISPTGYPHIGTIYQSWFDFAFAKKNKGHFIVRIEDTDQNRLVADAEEKVYATLDWFEIEENESPRKGGPNGPYRQSERLEIYKKYAQELIEQGNAYYCFCTKERLENLRAEMLKEKKVPMYDKHCQFLKPEEVKEKIKNKIPFVVRLKVPQNKQITMHDEIRGDVVFDSNTVDDQVLLKSDGFPTYFLAVVVDDHLMEVTHMVRGEEWLTSASKIILLYDYFGWKKPLFYHTSILRNPDKSKFSKRHGHTSVSWYQEQGFLPEAILNYLSLMGWSHPEEKDIFSREEFIKLFDLNDLKAVAPVFDLKKLEWMNGEYIRQMKIENLKNKIYEFYKKELSEKIIEKTIPLIQERIKKLSDYLPLCEFFFKRPESYELDLTKYKSLIQKMHDELVKLNDWKANIIGEKMQELAKRENVKNSEFFMVLRVAISGKKITPPLNDSMELLGKEECLKRLDPKGLNAGS